MIYEWDERKRIGNLEKHGLDFADSWKVFEASVKVTLPVPHAESGGVRWMDVAEIAGVVLVPVYTMRGDSVRNISFRIAKRKEVRVGLEGGVWVYEYEPLGILPHGSSQAEALDAFRTDFASAWEQIAKEDDARLTRDARALKKRFLSTVDRVETA